VFCEPPASQRKAAGIYEGKQTMERENQEQTKPRIYVASLADYNAGKLIGKWIEATQEAKAIHAEIHDMLKLSREPVAEEWAIHDYEGFCGLDIGEYSDIESVAEAATLVVEHGPVFAKLVDHLGGLSQIEEAKRYIEDGCHGVYDKLEHYVMELVEDCYSDCLQNLPDFIRLNIDYEGIARDMELGGDVFTIEHDHKVHVFVAYV
jgi:antirestriction protein